MGEDTQQLNAMRDHDLLLEVLGSQKALKESFDNMKIDERLRDVETNQSAQGIKIDTLIKDVDKLKGTSQRWDFINSFAAVGAVLFAWLKP